MASLEALTAAIEANTAVQKDILAAIKAGGGAGAAASGGATKAAGAKASAGPKKTTVEDVANAFSGYLAVKDKDERQARMVNVKSIVDYFGAPKATEIKPENFDEALGYLQTYIDGGTPEFANGGEADGEALV